MNVFFVDEPKLSFGHSQRCDDPRDGLALYGAYDSKKIFGIRAGVIGCPEGIEKYSRWVRRIHAPVYAPHNPIARPFFPGFEAVFGIPWDTNPALKIVIPHSEILKKLQEPDRQNRVKQVVQVFADRLLETIRDEHNRVEMWFIVIPNIVKQHCLPRSGPLRTDDHSRRRARMSHRFRRSLLFEPSLFPEDNAFAEALLFKADFRKQLKARLLEHGVVTQVVLESTISSPEEYSTYRNRQDWKRTQESAVAWNLAAAAYYKHGARPWKLADIRKGVCYVGLVYKNIQDSTFESRNACCAAQMFLDSGDGVVFRGAVGPWRTESDEYHLNAHAAHELISMVVKAYEKEHGFPPSELFIHGRTYFNDEEWGGFESGVPASTNVVGVRITKSSDVKYFTERRSAVIRGTAINVTRNRSLLWTGGYVPRLRTQIGLEVPRPLEIEVCRGSADWEQVVTDILGLTKLNYNSCTFADSLPVTLRFADMVGDILAAAPPQDIPPLQFYHYI